MTKYVYDFSEGDKDQKDLLGGKGANLAEMTKLGLALKPTGRKSACHATPLWMSKASSVKAMPLCARQCNPLVSGRGMAEVPQSFVNIRSFRSGGFAQGLPRSRAMILSFRD